MENHIDEVNIKKISFRTLILVMFTTLIVLIGLVVSWYTFEKSAEVLKQNARHQVNDISSDLSADITVAAEAIRSVIDVLSRSQLTAKSSTEDKVQMLTGLFSREQRSGEVEALLLGFENGDFLALRLVKDELHRREYNAPDEASYVIDSITGDGDQRTLIRRYYSDYNQLLQPPTSATSVYDPRSRSWFLIAETGRVTSTKPYPFYLVKTTGITFSKRSPDGETVVAVDITLRNLSNLLARKRDLPSTQLLLSGPSGRVYAYSDTTELIATDASGDRRIKMINEFSNPAVRRISETYRFTDQEFEFEVDGDPWIGESAITLRNDQNQIMLTVLFRTEELLVGARELQQAVLGILLLSLVVVIPIVRYLSHLITTPVHNLAMEAHNIKRMELNESFTMKTRIKEMHELAVTVGAMEATVSRYNKMLMSIAAEKDLNSLVKSLAEHIRNILACEVVGIYLTDHKSGALVPQFSEYFKDGQVHELEVTNNIPMSGDRAIDGFSRAISEGRMLEVPLEEVKNKQPVIYHLVSKIGYTNMRFVAIPLKTNTGAVNGLLVIGKEFNDKKLDLRSSEFAFAKAVSNFCAIAIDLRQLLKGQKELLDAFIKVIAGSIDAKSPYTGAHCVRVPEIVKALAKAAHDSEQGEFASFTMDDSQWEALHYAAWLHDCGKVTTPEHIVDKGTKLEAIYDRIHEVRMRFEVLKRDAEIEYLKAVNQGEDKQQRQRQLSETLTQLDKEFTFVAECNLGSEFMADDKIEQLKRISARTWQRTLDDRIGVSWVEQERLQSSTPDSLPCTEKLLNDKTSHLINHINDSLVDPGNPWGFKIERPDHQANLGELYNLSIKKGTLTKEDRFIINQHIVHTIAMLEQLPFPSHLRQISDWAGAHHEKMDGSGYPKKLRRDEMPLVARMMAIADIFEALTADDRPYKKAKKLSEAIQIMHFMRNDQHIDGSLFELFLSSGVYLQYARKHLPERLIDEIDIEAYLGISSTDYQAQNPH